MASKSSSSKVGVLLINLGTPDRPEPGAVRRYLAQFLSDPRVIEIPSLIWKPILHGLILRTRPAKSAHAYASIWEEGGSPLAVHTRAQAAGLARRLGDDVIVDHAMRYGRPSIAERLKAMTAQGCERILLAPLYPQYSAATTATAMDDAFAALAKMRRQPAIRTLPAYFDDDAYIDTLAGSMRAQLAGLDFSPDAIVVSFHGMPVRTAALGDPYYAQCEATTMRLSKALGQNLVMAFQSRFGRAKWFEPATEAVLEALGGQGARIAVIAPGFSADCVETLEELDIRGRETFMAARGQAFAYLSCLNAEAAGLAMLETLVRRELAGWLDVEPALQGRAVNLDRSAMALH